jgi:hypothetical protein
MNNQKILIYDFHELFIILDEIKNELNLGVIESFNSKASKKKPLTEKDCLIVTKENLPNIDNQLLINQFPIKISKLLEKFNIVHLKQKFNEQSEINIRRYKINLNSRELMFANNKLKLTEKESNIIIYLSKFDKPIGIDELQLKVWGYQSELETHTVETHIYRLRKKILKTFNDKNFIISKKNGYQII